jgi:hypothetical protein
MKNFLLSNELDCGLSAMVQMFFSKSTGSLESEKKATASFPPINPDLVISAALKSPS